MKRETTAATAALAMCLVMACGCVAGEKGAVTVLHWDSRSAEQLNACAGSDNPVFDDGTVKDQSTAKALPVGWWDSLMNMVSGLRVRIDIIRVEWNKPVSVPATNVVADPSVARLEPPLSANVMPAADMSRVLVVGDSWAAGHIAETGLDEGWPVMMGVAPELRQGIDGATAADWAANKNGCLARALTTPCDAVVVSLMGNDAFAAWGDGKLAPAEIEAARSSMSNVVSCLMGKNVPVYVILYGSPCDDWKTFLGLLALNYEIGIACPPGVTLISTAEVLTGKECWAANDRIHPSAEGHRRLAARISAALKDGCFK